MIILLRALDPVYSSFTHDVRQRDIAAINFNDISAQAYSEELSINQSDRQSDASALKAGKGKEKQNAGQKT
jgi:hypothetical protein